MLADSEKLSAKGSAVTDKMVDHIREASPRLMSLVVDSKLLVPARSCTDHPSLSAPHLSRWGVGVFVQAFRLRIPGEDMHLDVSAAPPQSRNTILSVAP